VQHAQQGGARALFQILSPILFPIFGKANSRDFPPKKVLTISTRCVLLTLVNIPGVFCGWMKHLLFKRNSCHIQLLYH
jgi:hypothetical protein